MNAKLRLFLIALLFSGCSSTSIIAKWQDKESEPKEFSKIAVIAITSSNIYRLGFENKIVETFNQDLKRAYSTMKMTPPMPEQTEENRNEIGDFLAKNEYDAILTISLLDDKEESHYRSGENYIIPRTYYNRFGRYYFTVYHRVNTPGYYENSRNIFLETNLYSIVDGKLLWSAQTKTVDPTSIDGITAEYAKTIFDQLSKDGFIKTIN